MKKILLIQTRPEKVTANSEYKSVLFHGKLDKKEVHRLQLDADYLPEIELKKYSAVIVGGGPFDLSASAEKKTKKQKLAEQWLIELMQRVVADDKPYLGICLGCGIAAQACGAKVSGKYSEELELLKIKLKPAGKEDTLLEGFPDEFDAFSGHKEAVDSLPKGAVLLASSNGCPQQLFRIKDNIYAVQFHPEADYKEIELRVIVYKKHGYFPEDEADAIISNIQGADTRWAQKLLTRFVEKYHK
jgi:GMP synthase (glutamine-hydrolysing)